MKILKCKRKRIFDVGFVDPNRVNSVMVQQYPKDTEANLLRFLKEQHYKKEILFPYNFR